MHRLRGLPASLLARGDAGGRWARRGPAGAGCRSTTERRPAGACAVVPPRVPVGGPCCSAGLPRAPHPVRDVAGRRSRKARHPEASAAGRREPAAWACRSRWRHRERAGASGRAARRHREPVGASGQAARRHRGPAGAGCHPTTGRRQGRACAAGCRSAAGYRSGEQGAGPRRSAVLAARREPDGAACPSRRASGAGRSAHREPGRRRSARGSEPGAGQASAAVRCSHRVRASGAGRSAGHRSARRGRRSCAACPPGRR